MARNAVAEVLDLEPALEAAGEESAEGRNQRRERRQHERVELRSPAQRMSTEVRVYSAALGFQLIGKNRESMTGPHDTTLRQQTIGNTSSAGLAAASVTHTTFGLSHFVVLPWL